ARASAAQGFLAGAFAQDPELALLWRRLASVLEATASTRLQALGVTEPDLIAALHDEAGTGSDPAALRTALDVHRILQAPPPLDAAGLKRLEVLGSGTLEVAEDGLAIVGRDREADAAARGRLERFLARIAGDPLPHVLKLSVALEAFRMVLPGSGGVSERLLLMCADAAFARSDPLLALAPAAARGWIFCPALALEVTGAAWTPYTPGFSGRLLARLAVWSEAQIHLMTALNRWRTETAAGFRGRRSTSRRGALVRLITRRPVLTA
ncbi:hypothetical protein, partial [Roseibium sp. RKSG952]|uniref:hypothetical protein n=1 Tax=Roseibium sp. RKSG952 TaxID=2529384 RepID=UPI0018AD2948